MERLTYRDARGEAWYADSGTEADHLHFIADIEDILGDNYDLDRLRELVEADREDGNCTVHHSSGNSYYAVKEKQYDYKKIQETAHE